jgi:hypothetical protein
MKPEHLRPAAERGSQRPAAVIAAALGVVSFAVSIVALGISGNGIWSSPDWRISVPGFVVTAIAAVASIARREARGFPFWLAGIGLAGASLVLGWFLMFAIVIAATVIVILILHAIM